MPDKYTYPGTDILINQYRGHPGSEASRSS